MVHNQLVNVLHNQCMEKDSLISNEIRHCVDSDKALLLREVSFCVVTNKRWRIGFLLDKEEQHGVVRKLST